MKSKETGIEELWRLVEAAGYTGGLAIDHYSAEELLRLFRTIWASEWIIFPDELTRAERDYTAQHGKLSDETTARLRRLYG